ncbi:B-cell receptor CD22-like [Vanacampus margaritifer]
MNWTAKTSFLVLLFGIQVVRGPEGRPWGGKYPWIKVCALAGATADLSCSFTYPPTINGQEARVETTLWFAKEQRHQPEDVRSDPRYAGRLHHDCHGDWCSLSIRELSESDSGVYKFRFVINGPGGGGYTVAPGVDLTVTDLSVQRFHEKSLRCISKCSLGPSTSYIWYENGKEIPHENSKVYTPTSYSKNSYSCAIKGHQQLVSPPVCVSRFCNKVHYDTRSICALKGSSVDIRCTYSSYHEIKSKFWFSPDHKHLWPNASVPQDLQLEDDARVQFPLDADGHSTLRIPNVTESDSAEYRFKFTARDFEWMNSLPGTNLTVTAAQVRVNGIQVEDRRTLARLSCHSSCGPPAGLSFCLSLNGRRVAPCSPSHGTERQVALKPGDYVTCDVEGHPLSRSPRLYSLRAPLVSLSGPGDIPEGGPLILNCSSDSPSAQRRWYKKIGTSRRQFVTNGPQLVFGSIRSSDSAQYFCTVENELGKKTSEPVTIDVKSRSATIPNNFIIRLSVTIAFLILVVLLVLCVRKKTSRFPSSRMQPNEQRHHEDYENIYASVLTGKPQQEDTP